MPIQFVKDASGRLVPQGDAKDTTAYVSEQPPAASKPQKPKQKNWWEQTLNNLQFEVKRVQQDPVKAAQTYARNASGFAQVNNSVRYEVNQLRNSETRGSRLATYGANAANSIVSQHNPALTEINKLATQGVATSGANLLRNVGAGSPLVDQAEDRAYQFTGSKPPSQMTPEEKAANDIKASVVANASLQMVGGAALTAGAPKAMALLDPAKAPNLVHAIGRAVTAEGLSDAVATFFEDNTGGSALGLVDALFGTKTDPVKPGMTAPEATMAALGPNAAFSIATAGLGAVVPRLLPGNAQARRAQRIVDERSRQRNTLESNGVVQSNPETGQAAFTPEALEQKAPPQTWKEAEAAAKERLGIAEPKPDGGIPSQEMAPGGAVTEGKLPTADPNQDPWSVQYDPDLPEADVGLELIERLDDEELKVALDSDDPVGTAAELLDNRPELNLDEIGGVDPELARADGGNLANPATPWRSQWQALPTEQLQAMAARSAELGERLVSLTGKTADEAVKTDLIDALDSLAADGSVYLPSRMNPDVTLVPTSEIQVDPARFQFKQGVDAQGQQKGNSLSGVEKWNTDLEQSIQLWLDPADGKPYVVNGHNRVAKARELGIPSLRAEEILAEDAVQARAAGALANIASGGGTPFDAAKFFRDAGITDPEAIKALGLPLQSGTTANGIALAQLPDNIFQDAVDGRLSVNKAAALGAAGLDEAGMQQAYKLLQGRDMTDGTWSELLQQAKSAPTVDGGQVDLFGNTEQVNLMVQKAELARLLRADISGDKKLFGRTAKNAGKLETAGNKIDAAASGDVATKAAGLLDAFDREKYLAGSPISEVLNRGAADVAAGAKPSVVAKRLKQQLVQALDQVEVPAAKPQDPSSSGFDPAKYERMSPEQLAKEKAAADKYTLGDKALANRQQQKAEIDANEAQVQEYLADMPGSNSGRELTEEEFLAKYGPDETQHPKLIADNQFTKVTRDLDRHQWATDFNSWYEGRPLGADERQAMQVAAVQKAAANGKVRPPVTPIPEVPTVTTNLEKAVKDLEAGEITDDVVKLLDDEARLQEHYKRVEAVAEAAQTQEVRDAIGYDELSYEQKKALGVTNGFEPIDTRGGNRFFHGAAGDIELRPGGEFEGDGMNIYGDGFYATDDLFTANKYQKKNKTPGSTGVTYEIQEKAPVKFYDLDKPADSFVLNRLRDAAGYDEMRELIETAIDEFDGTPSLAEVFDEMRGYSREFNIPAYEIQETWLAFTDALRDEGYGGFTHQGGKLAGNGKRMHQVRIYWDPSESIDIIKVDAEGNRIGVVKQVPAQAKPIEIPDGASRKITAKTDGSRIEVAAQSLENWAGVSADEAMSLVRAKGAILDPDKIPGLDMDTARSDKSKGTFETPSTQAVADAYRQFYGVDKGMPSDALASAQDFNGRGLPGGYQELPSYYEMNGYERARYNNMREIGESLAEEIRRVAGQDVQVNIDPRRYLVQGKVPGWAEGKPGSTKQIGGWYSPMEDMVTINNVLAGEDGRLLQTAYHEAFHRMQYAILTKQELDVMNTMPARMKTVAGSFMDIPKGTNLLEYQAVAFQKYAFARQLGIDPAYYMFGGTKTGAPRMQKYLAQVMTVFDKLWNVLERAHNWANGRGYQSIKDIYENAFLGKLGQREGDSVLEYITPDQVARTRVLEGWKKTLYSVDERVTQLDAEMNQIRALAAKEGC